jgi:hypothetical protein
MTSENGMEGYKSHEELESLWNNREQQKMSLEDVDYLLTDYEGILNASGEAVYDTKYWPEGPEKQKVIDDDEALNATHRPLIEQIISYRAEQYPDVKPFDYDSSPYR